MDKKITLTRFFSNLHFDRVDPGSRWVRSIFRRYWANRVKTREEALYCNANWIRLVWKAIVHKKYILVYTYESLLFFYILSITIVSIYEFKMKTGRVNVQIFVYLNLNSNNKNDLQKNEKEPHHTISEQLMNRYCIKHALFAAYIR